MGEREEVWTDDGERDEIGRVGGWVGIIQVGIIQLHTPAPTLPVPIGIRGVAGVLKEIDQNGC